MAASYVRTNLGKWGKQRQTFWEHGYLTHVFRRTLNYPAIVTLKSAVKCDDMERLIDNYLSLTTVEDYFHDYDKLYVPAEMLNPVDIARFKDHGNIDSERNRKALKLLIEDLNTQRFIHVKNIERDIDIVFAISEGFIERALRAANFSHEGDRTPEKFSMVAGVLKEFVEAHGCLVDNAYFIDFARIHMFTLRVADSIASAYRKPAFKSDVTEYLNIIDQKLGKYVFHVSSVLFNPVFIESLRYDVTKGYFYVYNRVYKALDSWIKDKGIIVEDRLSLIVALWLGPEENGIQGMASQIAGELYLTDVHEDIFHCEEQIVDPRADPTGFDSELRMKILELMLKYPPVEHADLMPCNSCGRPVVGRLWKSITELGNYIGDEAKSKAKEAGEMRSLETMGNLGYIKTVSERLYGISSSQICNSSIPLCNSCSKLIKVWAENYTLPRKGEILFTVYIPEVNRDSYRTTEDMKITGEQSDMLASILYSYHLKQLLTTLIYNSLEVRASEMIGVSAITIPVLFLSEVTEPIEQVLKVLMDNDLLRVKLPDSVVEYKPNFGMRIGAGPMSADGKVWDHSVLPGVYDVETYVRRMKRAKKLYDSLNILPRSKREDFLSYLFALEGCNNRVAPAIGRLFRTVPEGKEKAVRKRIDGFCEVAVEAARNPGSVYDLRIILSNIRGG